MRIVNRDPNPPPAWLPEQGSGESAFTRDIPHFEPTVAQQQMPVEHGGQGFSAAPVVIRVTVICKDANLDQHNLGLHPNEDVRVARSGRSAVKGQRCGDPFGRTERHHRMIHIQVHPCDLHSLSPRPSVTFSGG